MTMTASEIDQTLIGKQLACHLGSFATIVVSSGPASLFPRSHQTVRQRTSLPSQRELGREPAHRRHQTKLGGDFPGNPEYSLHSAICEVN